MENLIAHLDSDCFYVSAERVRAEKYNHCPVGVLGNNGACVIAKSYELREFGVKTGEPIWEAKRKCPEGIFIKRDFRWYEVVSNRMWEFLKTVSPQVEYYSIDEWFFDAGELTREFGGPLDDSTRHLQARIFEEIRIPVSIGVSTSKTLAKLGSDSAKPFGVRVLLGDDVHTLLEQQPISEVCGIGGRSVEKLAQHGIVTCADFVRADRKFIRDLLTIKGEGLWWELRGESINPIVTKRPQHKFVSRGGSVGRAITILEQLRGWLMRTLERLIEALNAHAYVCGTLGMQIEFKGHQLWSARLRLLGDSAEYEQLQPAALALLEKGWRDGETVTHLHLIAGNIARRQERQLSLFDAKPQPRIDQLKKQINDKLGRFVIRSGATLHLPELYQDASHDYEICDVQGKMCF
jgi:nucleotidyltransferase/DNA polymerase involved in DNA repair